MVGPIDFGSEQRMDPLQLLQRLGQLLFGDITSQLRCQGELDGIAMHIQVDGEFECAEWTKVLICGVVDHS
ncbi:hypothetical protein ABES25_21710 [Bacillus gobiensis]